MHLENIIIFPIQHKNPSFIKKEIFKKNIYYILLKNV